MKARLLTVAFCAFILVVNARNEIGFDEEFALAGDRKVPLAKLIPGTDDYYYYNCLHLQNQGKLAEVDAMWAKWMARRNRNHNQRTREIEYRQHLLKYSGNPRETLKFLTRHFGLHFNHQRELERIRTYPSELGQQQVSASAYWGRYSSVGNLEDLGLEWFFENGLSAASRRDFLSRLSLPDYPGLPKLVVDDLNTRYSRGFGSHRVHRMLTKKQLDEVLTLKHDLQNNSNFVNEYLKRLRPHYDEYWEFDAKSREAFLNRLWTYASTLSDVHNGLKVHILYHRLAHDLALGRPDYERFMTYLKLPRRMHYVNPRFLERRDIRHRIVSLGQRFNGSLLPQFRTDEPLVRAYLLNRFVEAKGYVEYQPYVRESYLNELFAEAKVVNGIGDVESWASRLGPSKYKALRDRVDLDFVPTNRDWFKASEDVSLELYVKNVKSLLVKVYEINTYNYYRKFGREMDTAINLDGLVPYKGYQFTYKDSPFRRIKRSFKLPELKSQGAYVVEFIGGGESSRALVRKGQLRCVERSTLLGHEFRVYNEDNKPIPDATIWLGRHEFKPDKNGAIHVPYSSFNKKKDIILKAGKFASLASFTHRREEYLLLAGMHLDREQLLRDGRAKLLVRAGLRINGMPVSIRFLKDVVLTISITTGEGTPSTIRIPGFKLSDLQEAEYELSVPPNVRTVHVSLSGTVQPASRDKEEKLTQSKTLQINAIDSSHQVQDLHLSQTDNGYVLYDLGKSGEVRAQHTIQLRFKHRFFKRDYGVTLQTDKQGRIELGALKDIQSIRASGAGVRERHWQLFADAHSLMSNIHAKAGETVQVPYLDPQLHRRYVSLLELRGNSVVKDCFDALSLKNGSLVISDLPTGEYQLYLRSSGKRIRLSILEGDVQGDYIMGERQQLGMGNRKALQIDKVQRSGDKLQIQLQNVRKSTRVHILATRFLPQTRRRAYADLSNVYFPGPMGATTFKHKSFYVMNRRLGDEYRYILERQLKTKFPGNMLIRPELLLNPWALRETSQGKEDGKTGSAYDRFGGRQAAVKRYGGSRRQAAGSSRVDWENIDFLPASSMIAANLPVDKNGVVAIPLAVLKGKHVVQVVAVDIANVVSRKHVLAESQMTPRNLRMREDLPSTKHVVETKTVTLLEGRREFLIKNAADAEAEVMDSLAKVYQLYSALSKNATLEEFSFILDWPTLKETERREKYEKYACHELNLFLYNKDKAFFDSVVAKSLANKKDKTFMDRYLLRQDLSEFREPWRYNRLNVVERILLSERLQDDRPYTSQRLREEFEMMPPDPDKFNRLFLAVLNRGSLGAKGDLSGLLAMEKKSKEMDMPTPSLAPSKSRRARLESAKKMANGKDEVVAEEMDKEELEAADDDALYADKISERRKSIRQLFRKLESTKEWAENNYYHLPIERQIGNLIPVNGFWADFAASRAGEPFVSKHVAEPTSSFAEMMLALAVLDLPFVADKHEISRKDGAVRIVPKHAVILFHKELQTVDERTTSPLLISQNFFRHGDRYKIVKGERIDKLVSDEFQVHTVYGAMVVMTNPGSAIKKVDLLCQIPKGAIPVANGFYTRGRYMRLGPHATTRFEYYFYFPDSGKAPMFPAHVARDGKLIAHAEPFTFNVVLALSKIDKESWAYISQHGNNRAVMNFLRRQNLQQKNLAKIAWRMRDAKMFNETIDLLKTRHYYDNTLWSYGLHHNRAATIRDYLAHQSGFLEQIGKTIDCKILTVDPVEHHSYQHLEYRPLVNPRAHQFGATRKILNDRFLGQYKSLMKFLTYKDRLDDVDNLGVCYYLILQDRVEEALNRFTAIDRSKIQAKMQYDYAKAYLSFCEGKPGEARKIAEAYADYPHERWRKLFAAVLAQVVEIEGRAVAVVDKKDRTQQQTKLSATEPAISFEIAAGRLSVEYQNISEVTINYYQMDLEFLFSNNPFVQKHNRQFGLVRPNRSVVVKLPKGKQTHAISIPDEYKSDNVMVELIAGALSSQQPYFANTMAIQVMENYGQLQVREKNSNKAIPTTYVKVYRRHHDGRIEFHKDGYTDLRGRFDYVSLNSNDIGRTERLAILIMSEKHGAIVKEVAPPKR